MAHRSSYSETLDELLGLKRAENNHSAKLTPLLQSSTLNSLSVNGENSAATTPSSTDRPVPAKRRVSIERKSADREGQAGLQEAPTKDLDQPRPATRHGSRSNSTSATTNKSSNGLAEAPHSSSTISSGSRISSIPEAVCVKNDRKESAGSIDVWSREKEKASPRSAAPEDEFSRKLMALAEATNRKLDALNKASEVVKALEEHPMMTKMVEEPTLYTQNSIEKPQFVSAGKLSANMESLENSPKGNTKGISATPASNRTSLNGVKTTENQSKLSPTIAAVSSKPLPRVANLTPKAPSRAATTSHSHKAPSQSAIDRLSRPRIRLDSAIRPLPLRSYSAHVAAAGKRREFAESRDPAGGGGRPISTTIASLKDGHAADGGGMSHGHSMYNLWLRQKLETEKEKRRTVKEKEEEEKRRREQKRRDAELLFQRWKADREQKTAEQLEKRRSTEKLKQRREKEMKEAKKLAAKQNFDAWRRQQSETEKTRKMKLSELKRQKERDLQEQKDWKKREAERAYEEWLRETEKRKANKLEMKQEEEEDEREKTKRERQEKKETADKAYRLWLEMKNQEHIYTHSLAYKILEFEEEAQRRWPSMPWLPTGNSVPRKFVGTGNRRKTLEKPLMLKVRQLPKRAKSAK